MTIPAVTLTERDGAIGTLPSGSKIVAYIGVSSSGTTATPVAYARRQDLETALTSGPLLEAAAYHVTSTRQPALVVRTGQTTASTSSALTTSGGGTSVVTLSTATADDDYEVVWLCTVGGTIGVTGIYYKLSFDGGRTFGAAANLGTATSLTLANGNVMAFAAGTISTGRQISWRTYAPAANSSEVVAALEALRLSTQPWDVVVCTSPIDGTIYDAVATQMALMPTKTFLGTFRMPTIGESDATYMTAFGTAFDSRANTFMGVAFGACKLSSAISGRKYKRPALFAAAPRITTLSEEQDAAWTDLGALPGCSVRDDNGNTDEHDELILPGGDDKRAITLRTFDGGPQGVYITNPRLHSAAGSDFEFIQHRRVMNLAKVTLLAYFQHRLSKPILVSAATGFILESEALEIEAGAKAAMRATLRAKPKCSAVDFTLSRTDNLLSTKTLTGSGSVVPLAYPKAINLDLGFRNPALQIQAV